MKKPPKNLAPNVVGKDGQGAPSEAPQRNVDPLPSRPTYIRNIDNDLFPTKCVRSLNFGIKNPEQSRWFSDFFTEGKDGADLPSWKINLDEIGCTEEEKERIKKHFEQPNFISPIAELILQGYLTPIKPPISSNVFQGFTIIEEIGVVTNEEFSKLHKRKGRLHISVDIAKKPHTTILHNSSNGFSQTITPPPIFPDSTV